MSTPDQPVVRLRPEILATRAYAQGRPAPADGFKLSSNENAYPPLPGVVEAVNETSARLNRYPDSSGLALRTLLAERFGVDGDEVHVGAGSVALIGQFLSAAATDGDEVVYSWRSFEAYPGLVTVTGASSVRVPNLPDGSHDLDGMVEAVSERTRAVIVCSPNNPTGTIVTGADFARFMRRIPRDLLVILDEAYYEFVTDRAAVNGMTLLGDHPNLVVLRTFSKAYGLAALRIGYAVGPAAILSAARSAAIPLSVTESAQAAAIASIESEDALFERVARIAMRRDRLRARLVEQGWRVPEAQGNFIWLATGAATERANDAFFDAGLTVRAFPREGIRVSVGEPESIDPLLSVAAAVLASLPEDHPARLARY